MILKPLDLHEFNDKQVEKFKSSLKKITNLLSNMKFGNEVSLTFDEFLQKLEQTIDMYIIYSLFITA